jgi:hypothetical protein
MNIKVLVKKNKTYYIRQTQFIFHWYKKQLDFTLLKYVFDGYDSWFCCANILKHNGVNRIKNDHFSNLNQPTK